MREKIFILLLLLSSLLVANEKYKTEIRVGATFGSGTRETIIDGYTAGYDDGGLSGYRIQAGLSHEVEDIYAYYYLGNSYYIPSLLSYYSLGFCCSYYCYL